jgi:hypothetical protein
MRQRMYVFSETLQYSCHVNIVIYYFNNPIERTREKPDESQSSEQIDII